MSSAEFTHWLALDSIDPLPDRKNELYLAQIAQVLLNVNRGDKQRAFTLEDLLLFTHKPPPSPDELEHNVRECFSGFRRSRKKEE